MSTTMIYNSKAMKEVKPDIVSICISFSEKADTAKEAIDKLTESRSLAKNLLHLRSHFRKILIISLILEYINVFI